MESKVCCTAASWSRAWTLSWHLETIYTSFLRTTSALVIIWSQLSYTTISILSTHLPSMVLGCEMNSAGFTTNLFPSTNSVTLSPHTGGPRWFWWLDPASESLTLAPELLALPRPLPGRSWIVCLSPRSWVCVWAWRCVTEVMVDECSAPAGGRVSGEEWSPVVEALVWETVACCWGWGWWWTCWSELLAGEEWALPLGLSLVVLRLWLVRGILFQSHKMLTRNCVSGQRSRLQRSLTK